MKIVILCQEEPVFLGPFLCEVIRSRPSRISAVVIAGRRSAGETRRSWGARARSLRTFWLLFEPAAFVVALGRRIRFRILGSRDSWSVEGEARRHGIPVHHAAPRVAEVAPLLRGLEPDLVLNQSEILLDEETLQIPTVGFVNRHASLLPAHRGRLGSFWAHADERPTYGITIHMVDAGIDTGDVIVQWEAPTSALRTWPFPKVLSYLNRRAPALFWDGVDRLERGEPARAQPTVAAGGPRRFPTLDDARAYRRRLRIRRGR